MTKKLIYLDYAAATPLDDSVIKSMQPYFKDKFYNPSSNSLKSKEVKASIENARKNIANVLGAKSTEIIFTAGGTEANNLAILGTTSLFNKGHIVTSGIEHESVLEPIKFLNKNGWEYTEVNPDESGILDVSKIKLAIKDNTILVSIMYVNNEIGTIQPIKQISKLISEIRKERIKNGNKYPIFFHTDAAQATNYLDIHVNQLGVDLMTINGGKIYGPKQSGLLFVKTGVKISPIIFGGGQENGLRSGTENVASIIGLETAILLANNIRKKETKRLYEIQQYMFSKISKFSDIEINGSIKKRLPNNVHLTISGTDNERVLYELENIGIICAIGSACSASKEESSHVLKSLGLNEDKIRSSLRISFGRATTKTDVDSFINYLKTLK